MAQLPGGARYQLRNERRRGVCLAAVLLVLVAAADATAIAQHGSVHQSHAAVLQRSRQGAGVRDSGAASIGGDVGGAGAGLFHKNTRSELSHGPRDARELSSNSNSNSSRARRAQVAVEEPSACAGIARLVRPRAERHVDKLGVACPFRGLPCPDNMDALVQAALNSMKAMTQAAIVDEGIHNIVGGSYMMEISTRALVQLVNLPWVSTYCESGFNAGHSVVTALAAGPPSLRVVSVGLYGRKYSHTTREWIAKKYPGRADMIDGDIYKALADWSPTTGGQHQQCDVIFADAHGHTKDTVDSYLSSELHGWFQAAVGPCTLGLYEGKNKYHRGVAEQLAASPVRIVDEVVSSKRSGVEHVLQGRKKGRKLKHFNMRAVLFEFQGQE